MVNKLCQYLKYHLWKCLHNSIRDTFESIFRCILRWVNIFSNPLLSLGSPSLEASMLQISDKRSTLFWRSWNPMDISPWEQIICWSLLMLIKLIVEVLAIYMNKWISIHYITNYSSLIRSSSLDIRKLSSECCSLAQDQSDSRHWSILWLSTQMASYSNRVSSPTDYYSIYSPFL